MIQVDKPRSTKPGGNLETSRLPNSSTSGREINFCDVERVTLRERNLILTGKLIEFVRGDRLQTQGQAAQWFFVLWRLPADLKTRVWFELAGTIDPDVFQELRGGYGRYQEYRAGLLIARRNRKVAA